MLYCFKASRRRQRLQCGLGGKCRPLLQRWKENQFQRWQQNLLSRLLNRFRRQRRLSTIISERPKNLAQHSMMRYIQLHVLYAVFSYLYRVIFQPSFEVFHIHTDYNSLHIFIISFTTVQYLPQLTITRYMVYRKQLSPFFTHIVVYETHMIVSI